MDTAVIPNNRSDDVARLLLENAILRDAIESAQLIMGEDHPAYKFLSSALDDIFAMYQLPSRH